MGVHLPVRRVRGETHQDPLSENVYRYLLPARYLLVARRIMEFVNRASTLTSHELVEEEAASRAGRTPGTVVRQRIRSGFVATRVASPVAGRTAPLRNHHTTTIAPTGTTSMNARTCAGCEPLFDVTYTRNVDPSVRRRPLVEFDDYFALVLEANGHEVGAVRRRAREQLAEGRFEGVERLGVVIEPADQIDAGKARSGIV